jgi:poly(hydroxyalkanoate) depolymerase family esterase
LLDTHPASNWTKGKEFDMKKPYDVSRVGVLRRGGSPAAEPPHCPKPVSRRRRRTALSCLVAAMAFGVLPAAASAATLPWLPYSPQPWWTYLPGMGSGGAQPPTTPTSTPTSSSLPGSLTTGNYSNGSGTLAYQLYVPSTYKAGTAMPLVVALHGCTETADVFRQLTRWDQLAQQKGFIVLFPQQSSSNNYLSCWNFFQTADMSRGAGEPAVIAGMTQSVQQRYGVDQTRTYVAGLSAGGAMSSVMAATYPDLYAAAGIGSGCEYAATATCAGYQSADPTQAARSAYTAMGSHSRAMPVIVFEGDKDTTVPPINAQQAVQQWQLTDGLALGSSVPTAPTSTSNATAPGGQTYTVSHYGDGRGHELIQSWLVHGMAHAWSGGSSSESYADPAGPDETGAMYAFFVQHPMS